MATIMFRLMVTIMVISDIFFGKIAGNKHGSNYGNGCKDHYWSLDWVRGTLEIHGEKPGLRWRFFRLQAHLACRAASGGGTVTPAHLCSPSWLIIKHHQVGENHPIEIDHSYSFYMYVAMYYIFKTCSVYIHSVFIHVIPTSTTIQSELMNHLPIPWLWIPPLRHRDTPVPAYGTMRLWHQRFQTWSGQNVRAQRKT